MFFDWLRRRSDRPFRGKEGFTCQFPGEPTRTERRYDRDGHDLEMVVYRFVDGKTTFSVTIRGGTAVARYSHADSIQSWLAEFHETMSSSGNEVAWIDERPCVGRAEARQLTFRSRHGDVLLRFVVIPVVGKLFVAAAIGPSEYSQTMDSFIQSFSVEA